MVQQHERISENKTFVTAAYLGGGTNAVQLKDNRKSSVVQQKLAEKPAIQQSGFAPVQRKKNHTGLPDTLKSGIENLSGHTMDDVKVHYNSDKPAQLNAHAYAQGTDIHIASGQEKHLAHEAWHVVQQKQGRVKPTLQMKGKVNVNDDKGLENEADIMGAKALQMKSKPQSGSINLDHKKTNHNPNIVQNILQRKVKINGVQKEPNPVGEDVPGYKPKHETWITDDYIRAYLSEEEYVAHDSGQAVKCGLLEDMGLWYRLPFPSAIAGPPASGFFVIGENHGFTPIKALLKASNQEGAKTLVESGAVFRETKMGEGEGAAANLATLPDHPNLRQIELGLAKALHAFAFLRAPSETKRKTAQPDTNDPYAVAGGPVVKVDKIVSIKGQTLEAWKADAAGKPKYRQANGILYYIKDGESKGILRPKAPGGNSYNQDASMEAFIKRPEIAAALPDKVRDDYNTVVSSEEKDRGTEEYAKSYTKAFNALRKVSIANLTKVYPAINSEAEVVGRSPKAKVTPEAAKEDSEVGMKHRNTVMVAGIKRAITEGEYVVASLGAQHVMDIADWEKDNHGLNIPIITYDAFIKIYSTEAEL